MAGTIYNNLPPAESLEVDEINLGSPIMRASAVYLGKYCDDLSKDFMLCKLEEKDPRKCLEEGKKLTACGKEFYRNVRNSCKQELEALTNCVLWNSESLALSKCRDQETIYDACMYRKLGMEKPPFGYFAQVRVHDPERPKPAKWVPEFPEPSGIVPHDMPEREATVGTWSVLGWFGFTPRR
ncbi:NADH dehydrogenase [ubiquinone] 1 alpha subcomplex subunit 8 [Tetranychus urticae]|uniref:NADH dehydrogenase [ubiquinone] 1 alpha subcomplex subunit 8 n=1 Tax=Tetranychus urticae TaxID=32264 RepID=T1L015_TETUR|nr:NADH dehydrogenase [ubiquinone] 1 alpha subcomplex subunit 8 [Tetranychus urticae]